MTYNEDEKKQAEDAKELFLEFPRALRKQWKFFGQVSSEKLMEGVLTKADYALNEKRDVFVSYLAQRIGYAWYGRRSTLTTLPLWDLLERQVFSSLNRHDKKILEYIATSTPEHTYALDPKAALAAIALWRYGSRRQIEIAERCLVSKGLASKTKFLYRLVTELGKKERESEVVLERSLLSLSYLQLRSDYSDVAALMGGLRLTSVFSPWRVGSPRSNLQRGCKRAAEKFPFQSADWINLIANAVLEGKLRSSWMEPVIKAAIRISVADPVRANQLRAYDKTKPYEADRDHIDELYAFELSRIQKPKTSNPTCSKPQCIQKLVDDFDQSVGTNPTRAIALLERVVEETQSETIQRVLAETKELDMLSERLFRAYIVSFTLDRYAVKFVKANRADPRVQDIEDAQIENFLIVCDYEHSFKNTLVDIAGMQIEHLDKDTAAKIRYFQTSRKDPNSITKLLARLTGRSDWLFRRLLEREQVADGIEFVFEQFLDRVSGFDFSNEVVKDLQSHHAQIENWSEIPTLPIRVIEHAIKKKAMPRVIMAGASGLLTGGLGPLSFGLSTVMDTTLLMYMAAEVCARYCWYYGFDPRENTDIIAMILGVALRGAKIRSVKTDAIRDDLRRVLMYRSMFLGAVSNGVAVQMMAPLMSSFFAPKRKKLKEVNFALPGICAGLAMSTNVSLIYDISESARWVLSDRFFARKYEHWNSRF